MSDEKMFDNICEEDKRDKGKCTLYTSKEKRSLWIYGRIDEKTCADAAYFIYSINCEDNDRSDYRKKYKRRPIKLYINSYGGSIYDMWVLIDTIMTSKTPVHTYCTGYAMSAAFQIFISGKKRYVTKHATLMYHQMYAGFFGKYQDLVEDQQRNDYMNEEIEDFVIERTNLTKSKLKAIREKKRDTYFNADDAIKNGIADKIIDEVFSKEKMKKHDE